MTLKFGVQATQSGVSWHDLLSLWQDLDRDPNFDHLWLMDHFVAGGGGAEVEEPCLEGWTSLSALAMATSRIRIGMLVSGNTYRHPAVLAKMATTVDNISNGRLEFGLGAGWHTFEHEAFGIPFLTTRERLDRLSEAAQLIKLLWTQPHPTFQGKYYQLDQPPFSPPNIQQPHPPILIGGDGERHTLMTVAKYADTCNVSGSPDEVRRKFEVLERHCRTVGRDFTTIRRTTLAHLFLNDDIAFQQRVAERFAAFRGVGEEEARRPLLLGSIDEVRAKVQAFVDAGVQEMILAQTPRFHAASLRRFSRELIPAFR